MTKQIALSPMTRPMHGPAPLAGANATVAADPVERLRTSLVAMLAALSHAAGASRTRAARLREELAEIARLLGSCGRDLESLQHAGYAYAARAGTAASHEAAAEVLDYLALCVGCALGRGPLPAAPAAIRRTPVGVAKALQGRDRAGRLATALAYAFRCVARLPLPAEGRSEIFAALLGAR